MNRKKAREYDKRWPTLGSMGSDPHWDDEPEFACMYCERPTRMIIKLCDVCWELKTRITANPDLAQRILTHVFLERWSLSRLSFGRLDATSDSP